MAAHHHSAPMIFVIDDDAHFRKTLTDILRLKHFAPLPFATGQAALAALATRTPAVALIDLKLGDMPGLDLMTALKAQQASMECIVLTGYATQGSAIEAVNLGAYGYLQKPYHIDQLVMMVTRASEKAAAALALQESEARYRSLFEDAPMSLWQADFSALKQCLDTRRNEQGITDLAAYLAVNPDLVMTCAERVRVLDVNQATLKLFRTDDKARLMTGLVNSFLVGSLSVFQDMLLALAAGEGRFEAEIEGHPLAGAPLYCWMQLAVAPGHEQDWAQVFVSLNDVTEQLQAREALQRSEEQYRITLDAMDDFIHVVDAQYKLVLANTALHRINTEHDLKKKRIGQNLFTLYDFLPPGVHDEYRQVFATGQTVSSEETTILNGRQYITETRKVPIFDGQRVSQVVTIIRDITDRRLIEDVLRKWASVFKFAEWGVAVSDTSGTRLEMVNPAFARMHHRSVKELTGAKLADVIAPEQRAVLDDHLRAAQDLGHYTFEARHIRADGSTFPALMDLAVVDDATQGFQYCVINVQEITEIKRNEAQLRALTARLSEVEEAERQRLVRELHDQVGQNLTAISLNLNVVQTQLLPGTAEIVYNCLSDSLGLLDQTAETIRNMMLELRSPVLDDYGLVAALRWHAKGFSRRTGVTVIVQGDDLRLTPNKRIESALFRITQEALTNVAKHAQAQQVIITVEEDRAASLLRLTVTDDGIGFDTSTLGTQDEHGGWGVLTMSERTESIGGRFAIESQPQAGTRIIVEVPH